MEKSSSDNGSVEESRQKVIIIPKERAVFWLDKNGKWNNEDGRFKLGRIVRHFNASIRRDELGYFVTQINGDAVEKVYFPYEDTALFAIDVKKNANTMLLLNNLDKRELIPGNLSIQNDSLYMQSGDERIKFSERSLVKISEMLEHGKGKTYLRFENKTYPINNLDC